ncbi:MAG: bifunctional ornithine acetyltransferase/N-acetylglutamate synthase, partial [Acidimicrobiales bacterium]
FTGRSGAEAARATAEATAGLLDVDAGQVHLASTGVIGEPLPVEALTSSLPGLVAGLGESDPAAWRAAADAIRTTDTYAKGSAAALSGDAGTVVGIAKGSGMIAPDMATMLAFVFTDLAVRPEVLHRCLGPSVRRSFNRITVDSDTSTSDTVLLYATGARPGAAIETTRGPPGSERRSTP